MGLLLTNLYYLGKRAFPVASGKKQGLWGVHGFTKQIRHKFEDTTVDGIRSLNRLVLNFRDRRADNIAIPSSICTALINAGVDKLVFTIDRRSNDFYCSYGYPDQTLRAALVNALRHLTTEGLPKIGEQLRLNLSWRATPDDSGLTRGGFIDSYAMIKRSESEAKTAELMFYYEIQNAKL